MAVEPIQGANWLLVLQNALAAIDTSELTDLASDAQALAQSANDVALTPANLAALAATEAMQGLVELATSAEVVTGTDTGRCSTPAGVKAALDARVIIGTYTADSDDDTAGTLDIDSGNASATSFIVQIYRSGVPIFSDQAVSMSAGVITVADGAATYDITNGDVINWMVG